MENLASTLFSRHILKHRSKDLTSTLPTMLAWEPAIEEYIVNSPSHSIIFKGALNNIPSQSSVHQLYLSIL